MRQISDFLIDSFAPVVTLASGMHAPRYKLHISEKNAETYYPEKSYDLVSMRLFFVSSRGRPSTAENVTRAERVSYGH